MVSSFLSFSLGILHGYTPCGVHCLCLRFLLLCLQTIHKDEKVLYSTSKCIPLRYRGNDQTQARLKTAGVGYRHSSYRHSRVACGGAQVRVKSYTVRLDSTVFESYDTESP